MNDTTPTDAVDPNTLQGHDRAVAWVERLIRKLEARAPRIEELRRYRRGQHPIRFATDEWVESFGEDFGPVIDNWMALVVEAPVERMTILGFRFGEEPEDGPRDPDTPAWRIWQDNLLDLESEIAHDEAVTCGYSHALTWQDEHDPRVPVITIEDALHAIVELDPANRRRRLAGLKRWRSLDGTWHVQLWTPDHTWVLKQSADDGAWSVAEEAPNPLRQVPLVPIVNNMDIYGEGHGDHEQVLPLQDAANKLFSDMMIASEFAAFHQRVLIGAEVPTDDDGRPLPELRGGLARWIGIEVDGEPGDGPPIEPKIVELRASNLENYIKPIQELVLHIAAQTKTPPTYILGQLVNVTADAIKAAEAALVKRTRRKTRAFGESWEEVMRLAFAIVGDDQRANDRGAEVIWDDVETISESQRVDAASKMKDLGVPYEAIWELLPGHTPRRTTRWRAMRRAQLRDEGLTLGITPNGADPEDEPAPAAAAA